MRIIDAYECICDKCEYKWSAINLPATCANKTCRSPRWNKPVRVYDVPLAEKNTAEASPVVVEPKESVLSELQSIMTAVQEKPKSDYYSKPIVPAYQKPDDQPESYLEPTTNWD